MKDGGRYEDVTVGIGLGCPLSPLMGALYLTPVDDAMPVGDSIVTQTPQNTELLNAAQKPSGPEKRSSISAHAVPKKVRTKLHRAS